MTQTGTKQSMVGRGKGKTIAQMNYIREENTRYELSVGSALDNERES